jgi:hypothetical protein
VSVKKEIAEEIYELIEKEIDSTRELCRTKFDKYDKTFYFALKKHNC